MPIKDSNLSNIKYFHKKLWNEFYSTQYKKKSKVFYPLTIYLSLFWTFHLLCTNLLWNLECNKISYTWWDCSWLLHKSNHSSSQLDKQRGVFPRLSVLNVKHHLCKILNILYFPRLFYDTPLFFKTMTFSHFLLPSSSDAICKFDSNRLLLIQSCPLQLSILYIRIHNKYIYIKPVQPKFHYITT